MSFTAFELFYFVILPLSIAVFGVVVAWLYGRGDGKRGRGLRPGE